ncbi:MAG TPA: protein translocase subunit SecD [Streptosporangiaceae bacterium]
MAPPSGNVSRPGRALAVLGVLIVVLFLAIVGGNIGQPSKWGSDFKVRLGLDLTSGTTVALEAQAPKGVSSAQFAADMTQAKNVMENRVNGAGFTEAQVQQQGSNIINVAVPGANSQKVIDLVGTTAQLLFRQVLLVAPNSATAVPAPTPSASPSGTATPSASASPSATASTKAKISISPNASTPGSASHARLLAAQAKASATPSSSASATPTPAASATPTSGLSTTADASGNAALVSAHTKALFDKLNCANKNWKSEVGYTGTQYNEAASQTVSCGTINGVAYKYALASSKVQGRDIKSASAGLSSTSVNWQVNLSFKPAGASKWGTLTTEMFNKYGVNSANDQLAVVLDGVVISSPVIEGAMNTGSAQITGNFTENEATLLANQLSYGALPLTFTKQSIQTISPQLGSDQLHAGLLAGAIGLLLVVLYCLLYYRGLAVVAVSSLIIASVLVFEAIILLGKYENLALELSGVAGLIVAIGITADSFVVFFERLRDEVRDGRTLRTAVERGWKRARRTVLVSDTVSFLAAALLWYFSIGEVKGFAFTLGLTTVIDVVVVFLFTKPMVTLLARTKFYGRGHKWSGLDPARLGARAPWRSSRPARVTSATPAKEA